MAAQHNGEFTKITATLFAPMYVAFDRQLAALFLRRDAFLDHMIAGEIKNLRADLAGKKLSTEAHQYISQCLKAMGKARLRQVSIAVSRKTADDLRAVVTEHNLVRDAFLNWLIVLLRSTDSILTWLDLPERVNDNAFRGLGVQAMPTSPLKAIEEAQSDPLYYLREACQARHECGLYALRPPKNMLGFSCYLPDEAVPDTAANKEKREEEERFLLSALELFESDTLATASPQGADHA